MEADVFPVDAHATLLKQKNFAALIPTVIPRSLKLPVGFSPSCFMRRFSQPVKSLIVLLEYILVFPSFLVTILDSPMSGNISSLYLNTPEPKGLSLSLLSSNFLVIISLSHPISCAASSKSPQSQKYLTFPLSNSFLHEMHVNFILASPWLKHVKSPASGHRACF